jgi:hypothetical protein
MQPLDQGQRLKVKWLHLQLNFFRLQRSRSLYARFHGISRLLDIGQDFSPDPLLKNTIGGADENEFKYQDESEIYPFG